MILGHSNVETKKDKKTNTHLKIGVDFWSSSAVKTGEIFCPQVCLYMLPCDLHFSSDTHMSLVLVFGERPLYFVHPDHALMFFEICVGGSGKNPTEVGRMEGGKRCVVCIMIDFYRPGSFKKNGVIISPNRVTNSSSSPVLVTQEKVMWLLD